MVERCRKMLAHGELGLDDDLRSLGAESMFFVEFAAELEEKFGLFVPVEEIEALSSARQMADWVDAGLRSP